MIGDLVLGMVVNRADSGFRLSASWVCASTGSLSWGLQGV